MNYNFFLRRKKHITSEQKPQQVEGSSGGWGTWKNDLTNKIGNDTIESVKIGYIDEDGNRAVKKIKYNKKKPDLNIGTYLNLGYYIVTPLLLGVITGIFLDKWLKTEPIFVLAGIAFGTISTFYNLIKLATDNATHKHKGRASR